MNKLRSVFQRLKSLLNHLHQHDHLNGPEDLLRGRWALFHSTLGAHSHQGEQLLLLIIINFVRNSYSLYSKSLTYKQETLQYSQKYSYLFKLSNALTHTQYSCILDFYIILNNIQIKVSHLLLAVSSASNIIIYSYQVFSKVLFLHPFIPFALWQKHLPLTSW